MLPCLAVLAPPVAISGLAMLAHLLVINEVMIRPVTGGSEWIEIFNAGDAEAPLAGVTLEDSRRKPVPLSAATRPIGPGEYRLIAASAPKVLAAYPGLDTSRVLVLDGTWPTLNDADGTAGFADLVLLREAGGAPVDSLVYHARWLGAAGVSLERVDARMSSMLSSNWSPCTADSLATPLRLNSLSLPPGEADHGVLLVPEEPFLGEGSPGRPAVIGWRLAQPASIAVELFDLAGRSVRLLKPLEESMTVGRVVWDGNDDGGHPVPAGVYLVLLEGRYDGEMAPRRWRRPIVVARGGR